jgi:transcriptional regulator with XRE-family HTH domain
MTDYIGLRVARWRDLAGMTQLDLANAVGCSRSYITMIESGDRPVTKRDLLIKLADALGVSVAQLLDQPSPPRSRDDLVMSRAAAGVRLALDSDGPTAIPDVTRLTARADEVISLRAACDYAGLAAELPALLADAQAVAQGRAGTDDVRTALDALVKASVYGALALKTSGYVDLAVRLAEHADAASAQLGNPVHVAAAQFALCQALMAEGVRTRALHLASAGADALQSEVGRLAAAQGWYVSLRLQAALCSASLTDHRAAAAALDDAAEAARGFQPDGWHRDDQAANVDVWRVTVALEDNGAHAEAAPDLARQIDRSKLRTPQRLARVYMDSGRGHFARGDRESTISAFMAAYDTAPGEVRNRGTVREIVGQLVREAPGAGGSDRLRTLAARLGIEPGPEM